ncbi:hypothetical protein CLPUN_48120 [Clostridium puniceum]|uniref:Uncharacterized protein n=1 Tax=Clostridium puniceum TaxID=29367 RepID=A0A1S8T3H9_9CLOT|nr:hypothetical protein CLPUN_48120 [Clostridium puniceum]
MNEMLTQNNIVCEADFFILKLKAYNNIALVIIN